MTSEDRPRIEVCVNDGGEAVLVLLRERVPEIEWVPIVKVGIGHYRRRDL